MAVDVTVPGSDCILWTGSLSPDGYGKRGHTLAHRVAYATTFGPIAPDMQIDHTCHKVSECAGGPACIHRRCVNPDHLEAVTPRVNVERSNGVAGLNMRKTHCPQNHPYDEVNTRPIVAEGKRRCRICRAEQFRAAQRRRKDGMLHDRCDRA